MRRNEGLTLTELMIVMAILSSVLGILFVLSDNLARTVAFQNARVETQDNVRESMQLLMRELRQSGQVSINWASLPSATLTYRRADDVDGNGTPTDVGGYLELGPQLTIQRDTADANGDGVTDTQLIITDGTTVRVVANGLLVNEDLNDNGALDGGEDGNNNGVLERGVWFVRVGNAVQITLQAQESPGPRSPVVTSELVEIVTPRN
jgi:prepilin-type N-terminal cleavage/methylation domain-containing protein